MMTLNKFIRTLFVAAVALVPLLFLNSAAPGAASGRIVKLQGHPKLFSNQKEKPAAVNAEIIEGDVITTGAKESLVVKFATGDLLFIGPLSKVTVTMPGKNQVRVKHDNGFVWAKAQKLTSDKRFEVQTPTAVAGVRGTAFSSIVESDDNAWFCVCDGSVEVQSGGKSVTAARGELVKASAAASVSAPMKNHDKLESMMPSSRECFRCHQGGFTRDGMY